MAQNKLKYQHHTVEEDLMNDPAGKQPARKIQRWRYHAVNYTAILQDYLDNLKREDVFLTDEYGY